MMKSVPRALALCLALALGLALFPIFPATTLAASKVTVGDTEVTAGSDTRWTVNGSSLSPVTDDSWTVKYESGVLTLRGANITGVDATTYSAAICANGDLTIVLEGAASVLEGASNGTAGPGGVVGSAGIYVDGKLTIEGAGALTSKSNPSFRFRSYGVWAKDVELKSGSLSGETTYPNVLTGDRWGVYADNSITVSGGNLTGTNPGTRDASATNGNYGVFAGTSINVTGGTLTGEAGRADGNASYGVATSSNDNASITISGGSLTGTAEKGGTCSGVYGSSIAVFGGTLSGTAGEGVGGSYGVSTLLSGTFLVSGGTLTGQSNHFGGGTGNRQAFYKAPVIGSGYLTPQVTYGDSSGAITGTGHDQATVNTYYTERYMSIISGPYTPPSPATVGSIPETGDSALPGLWLGLALLALAGLGVSTVVSKKKRHSN